ncbi:hypothetical protein [Dyella kyungheensis]|uniref:Uncharacterized protein n=1 Tax=Dyella kyungheensis TaxID=1242174 RepID=A0ABS2JME9_9GAMM|nr:hypothetical protein [Dyella kyungheensis]MBM7120216.1 hypothetical protein [Dyella kyungheensis]
MARTTKTVWYKRARFGSDGKGAGQQDLQSVLATALAKIADPTDRLRAPTTDGGQSMVINRYAKRLNMLVGQFISFTAGQQQPVVTISKGVKEFDLTSIVATQSSAVRKEFVDGMGFFAIHGNHVLLAQSKSLGSREFEAYLNWLLIETSQVLANDVIVTVADQPSTAVMRKVAQKKLRGVTVGTPLKPVAVAEKSGKDHVLQYEASGEGFDTLRGLFGADIFDKINLTEALDSDNVFVQVTIRVKGKRTVSDDTHKMLDALATAARHMSPDDIAMEVQGVGTVKGDEIKIHKTVIVDVLAEGGLVKEDDLWQKLHEWLCELIERKQIPA